MGIRSVFAAPNFPYLPPICTDLSVRQYRFTHIDISQKFRKRSWNHGQSDV